MIGPNNSRRSDRGAVAVLAAILATVLITVAALSVDLGNAWARKRDAQTQVDISALSAGYLLPQTVSNTNQIAAKVAEYLNETDNRVPGQPTVTAAELLDGNAANGEIYFSDAGTRMRVVAPPAQVDFGLAGVLGASGTQVRAHATVQVMSPLPPMQDVLPFWLPDGCPFGPGMADTGSGGGNGNGGDDDDDDDISAPSASPSPFVPGSRSQHSTGTITPSTATYGGSATVSLTITNLPKNSTGGTIRFTRSSAEIVDFVASWPKSAEGASVTVNVSLNQTNVTGTAGVWNVWPLVKKGNDEYPNNDRTFTVTGGPTTSPSPVASPTPTPTSVGCSSSASGQYGQMESPRRLVNQNQTAFALNIAVGLDHLIMPFANAPQESCGKKNAAPPAGGVQDKDPDLEGINCILPQTGNDGPWMLKGLITGVNSVPGRLDANANGHTKAGCGRNDTSRSGTLINNDVLSCYLLGGHSLDDIAQESGVTTDMLDPSVVDSPRFVWLPVIYPKQRSDIDNNTFFGIKRFVPGFITDEVNTATKATSNATADNGIVMNGNGNSLQSMQVFTFNQDALPIDERSPTVSYDETQGSIVRLVD